MASETVQITHSWGIRWLAKFPIFRYPNFCRHGTNIAGQWTGSSKQFSHLNFVSAINDYESEKNFAMWWVFCRLVQLSVGGARRKSYRFKNCSICLDWKMYDAINKLKEARQSFRSNYEIILTFLQLWLKYMAWIKIIERNAPWIDQILCRVTSVGKSLFTQRNHTLSQSN